MSLKRRSVVGNLRLQRSPKSLPAAAVPLNPSPVAAAAPTLTQAFPTLSLSPSATEPQLVSFLKAYLSFPITPESLLHFLKCKLHYHPKFTAHDFYIFQWAPTIDGYRHNHLTYEWMARTLAVSDRFDALKDLLQSLHSNPCPCSDGIFGCPRIESIFRFAVNSYCRVGRLEDALQAFDTMRKLIDGKPDVALYNILVHGFLKNGRMDKAAEIVNKMKTDRVQLDVFTYNILINGYCRNSKFKYASSLFEEMKAKGCQPNVVTFNSLIKGCFREKRFDDGMMLVYDMIEIGHKLSGATCEIIISGLYSKDELLLVACDMLVEFARKGVLPSGFDCYELIERLISGGKVSSALEVVKEMWDLGNAPSLISSITLIDGLIKTGNTGEALEFVRRMLKEAIVVDIVTFNCVLQDACSVGRTAEADKLRMLASSKGLDVDGMTYSILVDGYRREGKGKEGERVVDEMLDAGYIPDILTYNRLMNGLANGVQVTKSGCCNDTSVCFETLL